MSENFQIITTLCYGKDNDCVDELQDNVAQSMVYDPANEAWYLGEWNDE